jgi:hypothetical protein
MKRPLILPPTLPRLPAAESRSDRAPLLAGLAFMEGAASGWTAADLREWFILYGEVLHRRAPPLEVREPEIGAALLDVGARLPGAGQWFGGELGRPSVERFTRDVLPEILASARRRVAAHLRGLVAIPAEDRFLQTAIFAGKVRRRRGQWCAEPAEGEALGDVVLSLFVADALAHREFYDQHLCVCDRCERVSFNPAGTTRTGCADHRPERRSERPVWRTSSGSFVRPAARPPRGGEGQQGTG